MFVGLMLPILKQFFCTEIEDKLDSSSPEICLVRDFGISCNDPIQRSLQFYVYPPLAVIIGSQATSLFSHRRVSRVFFFPLLFLLFSL